MMSQHQKENPEDSWIIPLIQLILEQLGVRGADPSCEVNNTHITLESPKTSLSLGIHGGSHPPAPHTNTKIHGCSIPDIKWNRTMHTVSPPCPQIPSHGCKILFLIGGWLNCGCEKNLHLSGPLQFKPVIFKGQLYTKKNNNDDQL